MVRNKQKRLDFGAVKQPIVVAYGVGVDSTAVLVGMHKLGMRPDLVLTADMSGSERKSFAEYIPVINKWLRKVDFPEVTLCHYQPSNYKHWPEYSSLLQNCLTNVTLPSLAYGSHSCASKWKITAQQKYLNQWGPALECWAGGKRVYKLIGFEASEHELKRSKRCSTYPVQDEEADKYQIEFPLQSWGWDRLQCIDEIASVGLQVPLKSSCFMCPAMKPWEVADLATTDPEKLCIIVILEARTKQRHLDYAEKKGWPKGVGVPLTEGLWRKAVKGCRGATKRPGSMTQFIREEELLPGPVIDELIRLTPTKLFSKADFVELGIKDWDDWLGRIITAAWQSYQVAA